ncbi:MAG: 5-oxoprolinase subunit PxpA [Acidimicrobiales bacterium]
MPGERRTVDLNADVGEASDDAGVAVERALLGQVTSAHIACGGHAGSAESMRATVRAALACGVRVGAHPSYPDRDGFGRRPMEISVRALTASLTEQIGALLDVAAASGTTVRSVKAHGALYGEVARGSSALAVLLGVVGELCGPDTPLVLPSGAPALALARARGVTVHQEGFADRAYTADGGLMARQLPGSVFDDPTSAAAQALGLAEHGTATAEDGTRLSLAVDTLCVHGDSPNAPALARAVRAALAAAGIAVSAPPTGHL